MLRPRSALTRRAVSLSVVAAPRSGSTAAIRKRSPTTCRRSGSLSFTASRSPNSASRVVLTHRFAIRRCWKLCWERALPPLHLALIRSRLDLDRRPTVFASVPRLLNKLYDTAMAKASMQPPRRQKIFQAVGGDSVLSAPFSLLPFPVCFLCCVGLLLLSILLTFAAVLPIAGADAQVRAAQEEHRRRRERLLRVLPALAAVFRASQAHVVFALLCCDRTSMIRSSSARSRPSAPNHSFPSPMPPALSTLALRVVCSLGGRVRLIITGSAPIGCAHPHLDACVRLSAPRLADSLCVVSGRT